MLRKTRQVLASIIFVFVTLLFLDFTGTLHAWLGWTAKIQFLPAILALNFGVVVGLLLLTFLFGRVYCSVICPLGVFQDVVSRFAGKLQKNRFSYSPAKKWLRYGILAAFVVFMVAGLNTIAILVAPYSAYGRIASNIFAPIYQWGNNILAYFAERVDSYAFYHTDVWMKNISTFVIAVISFAVVAFLAWKGGRTYCNSICPVGTVLGFISKFSIFKVAIDADKCINCKKCSKNCKASCIDTDNKEIDYSRCVSCFDCVEQCKVGAMRYAIARKSAKQESPSDNKGGDDSRRKFMALATMAALGSVVKAQTSIVNPDGGLADIEEKLASERATSIAPPGAISLKNLAKHCTGCQLCVSVCPNQVLRPSKDPKKWMQPEMSYERGYCRPECVKCSEVCPTGAIQKITAADKSATQIGNAVWIRENCIVITDEKACTECERHCPTTAITMVPLNPEDELHQPLAANPFGPSLASILRTPVIDVEKCIGCGECENLCPGRPYSAIYVEGHEMHRMI